MSSVGYVDTPNYVRTRSEFDLAMAAMAVAPEAGKSAARDLMEAERVMWLAHQDNEIKKLQWQVNQLKMENEQLKQIISRQQH